MTFSFSPAMRRFFSALSIAVTVVVVVVFGDLYLEGRIQREAEMLILSKTAIRSLEEKRNSLVSERDRIRDRASDIAFLEGAFVEKGNPLPFIQRVEREAKERNILLKLSLPQNRKETLAMRIEGEGSSSNLLAFLRALEEVANQAIVEDLSFEVLGSTEKATSTTARFVATVEVLAK